MSDLARAPRRRSLALAGGLLAVFALGGAARGEDTRSARLEPKRCDRAKLAPSAERRRFVQVREHVVLGYRLTEVVLGRAALDDELPLVVWFHGRASAPELPTGDHADTPPVRLLFPWAPDRLGEGFTWFSMSITEERPHARGREIRARADELAPVLERFMARRPTRGRAVLTGFSQGGMLAFGLALLHPAQVEEAIPVAGWLPPELARVMAPEARAVPIRALHGAADPIVPSAETRALVRRLQHRGVDARLELFDADAHAMTAPMEARHRALLLEAIGAPRSE